LKKEVAVNKSDASSFRPKTLLPSKTGGKLMQLTSPFDCPIETNRLTSN
jgi:hypothetical protein